MRIEFFYLDGCPNSASAEQRLQTALRRVGRGDVVVDRIQVEGPEHAERLGFIGSPTIRLDGRDPFTTGTEKVGFACRVYTTPEGLSGSPTVAQLMEVLA